MFCCLKPHGKNKNKLLDVHHSPFCFTVSFSFIGRYCSTTTSHYYIADATVAIRPIHRLPGKGTVSCATTTELRVYQTKPTRPKMLNLGLISCASVSIRIGSNCLFSLMQRSGRCSLHQTAEMTALLEFGCFIFRVDQFLAQWPR